MSIDAIGRLALLALALASCQDGPTLDPVVIRESALLWGQRLGLANMAVSHCCCDFACTCQAAYDSGGQQGRKIIEVWCNASRCSLVSE